MSVEGTGAGATTTVGTSQLASDSSLILAGPLSAAWPTSGTVELNVSDTELMRGTISGTTVSNLTRAVKPYKSFTTAQPHTAGDTVTLVADWTAMQNVFPSKIDEIVLSGSAASVTFSSINQSFRHLEVMFSARTDAAVTNTDLLARINGDATAAYDYQNAFLNAAAITVQDFNTQTAGRVGEITGSSALSSAFFGYGMFRIWLYTSTTIHKNFGTVGFSGAFYNTGAGQRISNTFSNIYRPGTDIAVTSLVLLPASGNLIAGSVFTLFGLP